MRFEKVLPSDKLKSYINYFVISETDTENSYKVLPSAGLVIGFQYKGELAHLKNGTENKLASIGITGLQINLKFLNLQLILDQFWCFLTKLEHLISLRTQ